MSLISVTSAARPPVIIAGAGPVGMATAIELAQRGIASVVYEARAERATRGNVLNALPPAIDALVHLDPSGGLLDKVTPTRRLQLDTPRVGTHAQRFSTRTFAPDPSAIPATGEQLAAAVRRPDTAISDTRRPGTIPIETLENALREYATTAYRDLITLVPETKVTAVRNRRGFVEATIQPRAGGPEQVVRGAVLVNAAGRALDPGTWTNVGPTSTWIGARFPVQHNANGRLDSFLTRGLRFGGPDGTTAHPTMVLRTADRSIMWSRVTPADAVLGNEQLERDLMARNGREYGLQGAPLADEPLLHVDMEMARADSVHEGRTVKVGDAVRSSYFPSSSGMMLGIAHDAPVVADAIERIVTGGERPSRAFGRYAHSAGDVNAKVQESVTTRLHDDLAPLEVRSA